MTVDDLVDGQRLVQRPFRRSLAALAAGLGIVGLSLMLSGNEAFGGGLVLIGVLDLVILAAGRPLERFGMRRRAALLIGNEWEEFGMRRRAALLIGNEWEVSLAGRAVLFQSGGTHGEIAWSDLTGIREDAHTLALATGGVLRLALPKRAFGSVASLDDFRREALARIAAAQAGAATP